MTNLQLIFEEWRYVIGYEGLYLISNKGRVKSLARVWFTGRNKLKREKKETIRVPCRNVYLSVDFYRDGTMKRLTLSRLVALTFIPNPFALPEVNHIDGNKHNNNYWNLEWCTRVYNLKHAFENGLTKIKKVNQYDLGGGFIRQWASCKIAASELGFLEKTLAGAASGEQNTGYGFFWRYEDDTAPFVLKPNGKSVLKISKDGLTVLNKYKSITDAAKDTGVAISGIAFVCNGKRKTAAGFRWKFAA